MLIYPIIRIFELDFLTDSNKLLVQFDDKCIGCGDNGFWQLWLSSLQFPEDSDVHTESFHWAKKSTFKGEKS